MLSCHHVISPSFSTNGRTDNMRTYRSASQTKNINWRKWLWIKLLTYQYWIGQYCSPECNCKWSWQCCFCLSTQYHPWPILSPIVIRMGNGDSQHPDKPASQVIEIPDSWPTTGETQSYYTPWPATMWNQTDELWMNNYVMWWTLRVCCDWCTRHSFQNEHANSYFCSFAPRRLLSGTF